MASEAGAPWKLPSLTPGVWCQQSLRTDDKNSHYKLSMWTELSPTVEAEVNECLLPRKQTGVALEDW